MLGVHDLQGYKILFLSPCLFLYLSLSYYLSWSTIKTGLADSSLLTAQALPTVSLRTREPGRTKYSRRTLTNDVVNAVGLLGRDYTRSIS